MRKKAQHASEAADVNITPLLDIVFILLIFFIVTATFLREKGLDVVTPSDCDDCTGDLTQPLLLAVQEDGFIRVNNIRSIDPGSVKPVVQEYMARFPQGVVIVTAAPESQSGVAVQVLDQAEDGGAASRITLALQKAKA